MNRHLVRLGQQKRSYPYNYSYPQTTNKTELQTMLLLLKIKGPYKDVESYQICSKILTDTNFANKAYMNKPEIDYFTTIND